MDKNIGYAVITTEEYKEMIEDIINKKCIVKIVQNNNFCNKKECKPIWWHNTKGYGIPERKD